MAIERQPDLFLIGWWPVAALSFQSPKAGVSKAKRGNRRGNKINIRVLKPSIHAGFKTSFKRFHTTKSS